MRITAYATVRDEVPGRWAEQLSSDDPWLAQYLRAVADSYLESSGPVLSLEVSHLIRHIRDSRRRYVFECDSIEGLREWAAQANAVLEMPDRRVLNGVGQDIMAGGTGGRRNRPSAAIRGRGGADAGPCRRVAAAAG